MLKAFKYRINPNEEQKVLLAKHFGSVRFLFNRFLNERKTTYEENKAYSNYNLDAAKLTELKKNEDFAWLKEVNSQSLQFALKCLDTAYHNFFKKRADFPNYKNKNSKQSFCVPQSIRLENNNLFIPKFKDPIKVVVHRKFNGTIKQCTISKSPSGDYYVSVLVDTIHLIKPKTGLVVGIDLGIKDFVITSDGYKYKNNRYTKTYAKKLKAAQQHLSRKVKGSNHYNKQKIKVARLHEKITNSRKDNLHKVSTDLINKYDVIVLEDLNVKGMIKNHKLSKHISDASWGSFVAMLQYKAAWNEKTIKIIDRWFPSSKTCGCCGYIKQNLSLKDREWTCPSCNSVLDRDFNAAKNILKEGLRNINNISAGTVDNKHGDQISPSSDGTVCEVFKAQLHLASEAHKSLACG